MKKIILSSLVLAAMLSSCNNSSKTTDTATTDTVAMVETPITEPVVETETEMSAEAKQELAQKIDAQKVEIETQIKTLKAKEVKTTDLREQIKQKWDKIHFYTNAEGQVIRIKTYPYEKISKRTEEFYFQDGKLIVAVIEDDGTGEVGKDKEKLSKVLYFNENKFFHGINNNKNAENPILDSQGERLMEEANEYVKIYSEKM